MEEYKFDADENSDEEIEELAVTKSQFERDSGLVFSKRGIIDFIENLMNTETVDNKGGAGKSWEEKSKTPNFKFYIKSDTGNVPFIR